MQVLAIGEARLYYYEYRKTEVTALLVIGLEYKTTENKNWPQFPERACNVNER